MIRGHRSSSSGEHHRDSDANANDTDADEEFYDTLEGSDSANTGSGKGRDKSTSNGSSEEKGNYYTQLNNFIGLSSPQSSHNDDGQVADDDKSGRGSLISSLSSYSQDGLDNSGEYTAVRRASNETQNNDENNNETNTTISMSMEPNPTNDSLNASQQDELLSKLCYSTDENGHTNPFFQERVRVSSVGKDRNTNFHDLRLVQKLIFHEGSIWTMKFSPSGQYLCSAGHDNRVIVWCIGNLPKVKSKMTKINEDDENSDDDNSHSNNNNTNNNSHNNSNNNSHSNSNNNTKKVNFTNTNVENEHNGKTKGDNFLIYPDPYRIYEGHTADVIDIAWSRSHFILSASFDKTVRLWHVSRNDCLQFFKHQDIVTSVEFHPLHDRYFISGCFDRRLRVWDIIPDGNVREWAQTPHTVSY